MVYRDTVIVPPALEEGFVPPSMRNTPGYVMAFDARSGKQKWAFHTVPKNGEPGAETWEQNSNSYTGNTGVWAPISVDPELGYAYLPVETPTNDYYAGHRLGSNLFANSVVCLDLETGKQIWHYQVTHHDIWNYDLPSAPALVNITVSGRPVRALVQLSKQGYAYVLDRVTGEPIWPIEERRVPASDVPGERAWPTQPHPTKPPPYEYQGYVENDLIDFTPNSASRRSRIAKQYRLGPLFEPPSEIKENGTQGTWYNPGSTGGALWQGGGFDPENNYFYIPSRRVRASLSSQTIRSRICASRVTPTRALRRGPADPEANLQSDHRAGSQHGRIRLGRAARYDTSKCFEESGSCRHHVAQYRWHQSARDASRYQDVAYRGRGMGRRTRRPCLRQEDRCCSGRSRNSGPDGQHAR